MDRKEQGSPFYTTNQVLSEIKRYFAFVRIEKFYLIGDHPEIRKDAQSYCGVLSLEEAVETRWENLLKKAGVFKSNSEARKNGFIGLILEGYHYWKIGKLAHSIEVLHWNKNSKQSGKGCKCTWCLMK